MKLILFFVFASSIFFISCSIEKRHYLTGFNLTTSYFKHHHEDLLIRHFQNADSIQNKFTKNHQHPVNSIGKKIVLVSKEKVSLGSPKNCNLKEPILLKKTEGIVPIGRSEICERGFVNGVNHFGNKLNSSTPYLASKYQENSGQSINAFALASMICGIVSICTFFLVGVLAILGIIAIVLGLKAIKQMNLNPDKYKSIGRKFAWAGIICGIIGLVILLAFLVLAVLSAPL